MDEVISKIEKKIWQAIDDENRIGLLDGLSGIAMFYNSLYSVYKENEYQEKLLFIIDKIDSLISEQSNKSSLCSGLAGYGWVLLNLNNNDIDIDEDYFISLDLILAEDLKKLLSKNNYDFLHGAMGIVFYFINRNKITKNDFLIEILNNFSKELVLKISSNLNEILIRESAYHDDKCYYFGIAHGVSGVINFLIYVFNNFKELKVDIVEPLNTCIAFLKKGKKYDKESKQFFPNLYMLKSKTTVSPLLGWCQGDLGISNSLYNASILLNDYELRNEAIELMDNTKKISFIESKVKDAGICHGSTGILMQYHFASIKFRLDYSNEIKNWNIIMTSQTKGFEEFLAYAGKGQYVEEVSLLKGASGLGMVLLTINNKIDANWFSCLNIH